VDTATLLGLLRRLATAQPGREALHLPAGLSADRALEAVRAAVEALEPPRASESRSAKPPEALRVHIDGASRGNPGPAGVGVLFLGPDGRVVERLHRGIGDATNNVAEYAALLLALERASAMGVRDIEAYSDSELLVRQLQGRYQVKHPTLRSLHAKARERIAGFRRFTIHHVPRESNAEADTLANRGIEEAAGVVPRSPRATGRRGVD
jgi:ribonuclease HI